MTTITERMRACGRQLSAVGSKFSLSAFKAAARQYWAPALFAGVTVLNTVAFGTNALKFVKNYGQRQEAVKLNRYYPHSMKPIITDELSRIDREMDDHGIRASLFGVALAGCLGLGAYGLRNHAKRNRAYMDMLEEHDAERKKDIEKLLAITKEALDPDQAIKNITKMSDDILLKLNKPKSKKPGGGTPPPLLN